MENQATSRSVETKQIVSNLGTFAGFNLRSQSAIERTVTATEVVCWNHRRQGKAKFWPSGDCPAVSLLFKRRKAITGAMLLDLDRLLVELDGDMAEDILRIHYWLNVCHVPLKDMSAQEIDYDSPRVYIGENINDLRREAVEELFEIDKAARFLAPRWNTNPRRTAEINRFLTSRGFYVKELDLGEQKVLLVHPCANEYAAWGALD